MAAEFLVILIPILHKFEDLKIANFLNPEEVYFLVTRVKWEGDDEPGLCSIDIKTHS